MPGALAPIVVLVLAAVFPLGVLMAALRDATTLTIPNRLTIALAVAFAPAALAAGLSPMDWGVAFGVGTAALVLGMVMFALGWVGGGDAKLFAACGLWIGASAAGPFLLWTGLAGGVLAGGLLLGRQVSTYYPGVGPGWVRRLLTQGEGVPYGVAIAAGALVAFPLSPIGRVVAG